MTRTEVLILYASSGGGGGGGRNRTGVQGFAGPCLSHSATPPGAANHSAGACRPSHPVSAVSSSTVVTEAAPQPPLDSLRVIAVQEKAMTPTLDHVEMYTMEGLLTLLWHGPRDAHDVVLMCGGAMGGLLGPGEGVYQELGSLFSDA